MTGTTRNDETHPDAGALERYRRRVADPIELLAVDAHLACCDLCFAPIRIDNVWIDLGRTDPEIDDPADFPPRTLSGKKFPLLS